jgi:arginine exporter protein ArgO
LGIRTAVLSYTRVFAVSLSISATSIPILTRAINAVVVTILNPKQSKKIVVEGSSASTVEENQKHFRAQNTTLASFSCFLQIKQKESMSNHTAPLFAPCCRFVRISSKRRVLLTLITQSLA